MQVWIHSPYESISQGLQLLVAQQGFETSSEQTVNTEVAVWDLTHRTPPFPNPSGLPTLAIIVSVEYAVDLLHRGYHGYIGPDAGGAELRRALPALRRGEIWAERRMLTQTIRSFTQPQLTGREEQIFGLISKGWSNRAIARELKITERTVKAHASRLYEKLGVRSRVELIVTTHENGHSPNGHDSPSAAASQLGD